jgi:hypothetical protein
LLNHHKTARLSLFGGLHSAILQKSPLIEKRYLSKNGGHFTHRDEQKEEALIDVQNEDKASE